MRKPPEQSKQPPKRKTSHLLSADAKEELENLKFEIQNRLRTPVSEAVLIEALIRTCRPRELERAVNMVLRDRQEARERAARRRRLS